MRRQTLLGFVAGIGVTAAFIAGVARGGPPAAAPARQQWEYKVETTFGSDVPAGVGDDGWELVAVTPPDQQHGRPYSLYFKRSK